MRVVLRLRFAALSARIARCDWRAGIGNGLSLLRVSRIKKNTLLAGYAALQHIA